ncbi:MAG: alpha-mannosidase, partial [Planctomycetes bacterium]|nr:alpha-mannosidase [Planctomycetota bacterium]
MAMGKERLAMARMERLSQSLPELLTRNCQPLATNFRLCGEGEDFSRRLDGPFEPLRERDPWGSNGRCAWFHLSAVVPEDWAGKEVVARIQLGGEAQVHAADGSILQGLSAGSTQGRGFVRDLTPLFPSAQGGEAVELWIHARATGMQGLERESDPDPLSSTRHGTYRASVKHLKLCLLDRELWNLHLDYLFLLSLSRALPAAGVRRARILKALCEVADLFRPDGSNTRACRDILRPELEKRAGDSELTSFAVGHAHSGNSGVWSFAEGEERCLRIFSTQLTLLEASSEHVFGASQALRYEMVKHRQPELFARIREAIAGGRIEPLGAMWAEADCNLCSGESLVRQILHGKNFFQDEFDLELDHLWLSETHGFTPTLPQIARKCGLNALVTRRVHGDPGRFAHHSFRWCGLDGTELPTHLPPSEACDSALLPETLSRSRDAFLEKDFLDLFLSTYGGEEGGCGPDEEALELARRAADCEGCPKVLPRPARDFLAQFLQRRAELPAYSGDLYLDHSQGTFTSQAAVKFQNRRLEHRLRACELLYS